MPKTKLVYIGDGKNSTSEVILVDNEREIAVHELPDGGCNVEVCAEEVNGDYCKEECYEKLDCVRRQNAIKKELER